MQMQRHALYNLLRMNWKEHKDLDVEPWQVEDYRKLTLEALFKRLSALNISLDRVTFLAFADDLDTPEDFADSLNDETDSDPMVQDQIYLLIFEFWRRLVPEKQSLSIFCDELDRRIEMYDSDTEDADSLPDALANLAVILDENTDQGATPREIFESICDACANDLEDFLYDFIADQIDNKNESYAAELLDDFDPYLKDNKWFDLLKARVAISTDIGKGNLLFRKTALATLKDKDLEFNFEMLSSLIQGGEKELFKNVVEKSLSLITNMGEFQELLSVCADYYHFLDQDHEEKSFREMLQKYDSKPPQSKVGINSPEVLQLRSILK